MSNIERKKINNVLKNITSPPKMTAIFVFLAALLARLSYWIINGTSTGGQTSSWISLGTYNKQQIVDILFSPEAAEFILYAGYWMPLSIVARLTGGSLDAIVFIQIVLSSLGCVIVFDIGRRHVNLICGITAGLSLTVLFETFAWSTRVLSDTVFTFVLILSIWMLAKYRQQKTTRNRVLVLLVLGYLAITRPYGTPIVFGWLLYDITRESDVRFGLFKSPRMLKILIGIGVPIISTILIWRWGHVMVDFWLRGILVADDPSFPRYPFAQYAEEARPSFAGPGSALLAVGKFMLFNIHHIVAMAVLKIIVFFLPVVPRFSTLHNVINIFTFVPIYILGFIGIVRMYRNDRELFRIVVTPLAVILIIISLTFTDWGWGYRAPTGPIFSIAAGYTIGTDARVARIRERLKTEFQTRM